MMRVLIDTDVVLDLLLKRAVFYQEAFALWQAADQGLFERYISAITPVNVFYISRKPLGSGAARQVVGALVSATQICAVDSIVLRNAHALPLADYEDAVQTAAALAAGLDAIVTRNGSDYQGAPITILTPADLIARVAPTP